MTVEESMSYYSLDVQVVFCMSRNSFLYSWLGIVCNGVGSVIDESKDCAEEGSIMIYQWLHKFHFVTIPNTWFTYTNCAINSGEPRG
jgi:hypothetical protein